MSREMKDMKTALTRILEFVALATIFGYLFISLSLLT
jgi:hypothetical protein